MRKHYTKHGERQSSTRWPWHKNYEEMHNEEEITILHNEFCKPWIQGKTTEHVKHFRESDYHEHLPNAAAPTLEEDELLDKVELSQRSNPLDANFAGQWRYITCRLDDLNHVQHNGEIPFGARRLVE